MVEMADKVVMDITWVTKFVIRFPVTVLIKSNTSHVVDELCKSRIVVGIRINALEVVNNFL